MPLRGSDVEHHAADGALLLTDKPLAEQVTHWFAFHTLRILQSPLRRCEAGACFGKGSCLALLLRHRLLGELGSATGTRWSPSLDERPCFAFGSAGDSALEPSPALAFRSGTGSGLRTDFACASASVLLLLQCTLAFPMVKLT